MRLEVGKLDSRSAVIAIQKIRTCGGVMYKLPMIMPATRQPSIGNLRAANMLPTLRRHDAALLSDNNGGPISQEISTANEGSLEDYVFAIPFATRCTSLIIVTPRKNIQPCHQKLPSNLGCELMPNLPYCTTPTLSMSPRALPANHRP